MQFYRLKLLILETKYASNSMFFLTGTPLKMSLDWHPPNLLGLTLPLNLLSVGIMFRSSDWHPPTLEMYVDWLAFKILVAPLKISLEYLKKISQFLSLKINF